MSPALMSAASAKELDDLAVPKIQAVLAGAHVRYTGNNDTFAYKVVTRTQATCQRQFGMGGRMKWM